MIKHMYWEETKEGDPGAAAAPAPGAPAAGEKTPTPPSDAQLNASMEEAISKGLKYTEEAPAKTPEQQAEEAKSKDAGEAKATQDAAEKRKAELAAMNEEDRKKAEDEDRRKAEEAKKPKQIAPMTEDEKRLWAPKSQQRFQEAFGEIKRLTAANEQQATHIKGLEQSRDAILGVLEETHTTDEQLSQLLEYNRMVQTGDLEGALKVVNAQRAAILRQLGREEPGVDLLSDFPDLAKEVEDEKKTREHALLEANRRRSEAQAKARAEAERKRGEAASSGEQKVEAALTELKKWGEELARTDLDYKAKEGKLLGHIEGVVQEYPPHLWVPTLKRLYAGLSVDKPAAPRSKDEQGLRPSGVRPGAPQPKDALEAIEQGLGYAKTG